jgi:hypothetical protein
MKHAIIYSSFILCLGSLNTLAQIRADVGYSFRPPANWNKSGDDGAYAFTKPNSQVSFTIQPHDYPNRNDMAADIKNTGDESSSTYLKATYAEYGSTGLYVKQEGWVNNTQLVIHSITLFSPHGVGITLALTCPANVNSTGYQTTLKEIASSVQFYPPRPSQYALQWKRKIIGKQLLYLYSQTGSFEKRTFNLCSNGTFTTAYEDGYSSDGYTFNANNDNSGKWEVYSLDKQGLLYFQYRNGTVKIQKLNPRNNSNEISVDGTKYLVTNIENCR